MHLMEARVHFGIQNGYVEIPKKPGLGVELNEEAVANFTVHGD